MCLLVCTDRYLGANFFTVRNMGKKNRRRDMGQFKLPSATSETSKKNLVSAIEERDPGYHRFQTLPADVSRLVVAQRFGGLHGGSNFQSVKISVATVYQVREARRRSRHDAFEGEKEIWDARDAMVLDEWDGMALDAYLGAVVGLQFAKMIAPKARPETTEEKRILDQSFRFLRLNLNVVKRWSRVRPQWRRFYRRLCHNCPAFAHLTEPRYMVCSGCGMARYCSEECQRQHWPLHREQCMACQELISITPPAAGRELIKNFS